MTGIQPRVDIPDSPAGNQLRWALGAIGDPESIDRSDVGDRLTPAFLQNVPVDTFIRVAKQIGELVHDSALTKFEGEVSPTALVGVLETTDGSPFRVQIAVEPKRPHKIAGLVIQPAPDLRREPAAKSWKDLEAKLRPLASRVGFLAAEVVDDELIPVFGIQHDDALAMGSAFKLYILGALAKAIEAGRTSWDEQLTLKKSMYAYSSEMQNDKPGKRYPVSEFAMKMISISDNTATDHLLFHLGRDQVESMQAEMGHSDPSLNEPFISAREMFVLKAAGSPHGAAFLKADRAERRNLVENKVARAKLPPESKFPADRDPTHIDEMEWFASAADLGRAMVWLRDAMQRAPNDPLKSIISRNPGLPFDRTAWPFIAFKGGSEPGVINMTWLLERLDGRWFTLACTLNDSERSIDVMPVSALMVAGATLLVMHRRKTRGKPLKA